jgi:membrane protease subunit HflK
MPWSNQGGGGPWGGGGGGGPGPWGRGSGGPGSSQPNLEEFLRRLQEQLRRLLPGGGGGNGRLIAILVGVAILIWLATGAYRVEPDEEGIALIFGKWVDTTGPGLNYNFPSPIGTVYTPKVTRVSRVEIGFRSQSELGRPQSGHDVPAESLMLTGDENVIDVQFVVFWLIKDAGQYLFNIRDGDGTVKDVAEASMREIIGQSNFEYARTQGRANIELDTQKLIQRILDSYGAGILLTAVRLQKVDPPEGAIDAFRDVQAARADKERAINEAQGYLNEVTQKAQGQAEQVLKDADAYKSERINMAQGDTKRFNLIYAEYLKNKDITTRRIYLDTMSSILGDMDKVLIEGHSASGVLPLLPLQDYLKKEQNKSGKEAQP